jgi:hypothetical protein
VLAAAASKAAGKRKAPSSGVGGSGRSAPKARLGAAARSLKSRRRLTWSSIFAISFISQVTRQSLKVVPSEG